MEVLIKMITRTITANGTYDIKFDQIRSNQSIKLEKSMVKNHSKNLLLICNLNHKQPLLVRIQIKKTETTVSILLADVTQI